ncbi:MAG: hypothetical protein HOM96_01310 [Rickettsiales bacterium]|nr:hypothetical protein [Rickettsiales bacterium]
MADEINNFKALLKNKPTKKTVFKDHCEKAFAEILSMKRDGEFDNDDYEEEMGDLVEAISTANISEAWMTSLNTDTQKLIIRAIYVNGVGLDLDLDDEMQNFFMNNIEKSPPTIADDLVSLYDFYDSAASDFELDNDLDDEGESLSARDKIFESIPANHLLEDILKQDNQDAFQCLLNFDKLTMNPEMIVKLAEKPAFLNQLFIDKYKDDPSEFKQILEKVNMRGNGAQVREYIDKYGKGLDSDFLNITRTCLKSSAEKEHEDKTTVAITKLENQRDNIQEDIYDLEEKGPKFVSGKYLNNKTTRAAAVYGTVTAFIVVATAGFALASFGIGLVVLAGFLAVASAITGQECRDDKAVHDIEKGEKYEKLSEVNKAIDEQRNLLPEHSKARKGKVSAPETPDLGKVSGRSLE